MLSYDIRSIIKSCAGSICLLLFQSMCTNTGEECMKIQYKGYQYKCSFTDSFIVMWLETRLFFRRRIRRFRILFSMSDLLMYFFILLIWMVFVLISNRVYPFIFGHNERLIESIWNLKNSIFSSVVLAFFINSYNRILTYKNKIRKQHYMYVDAMDDFEEIVKPFFDDGIQCSFHPFYNQNCFDITKNAVGKNTVFIENTSERLIVLDCIQQQLFQIEKEIKNGNVIITDDIMTLNWIDNAKKCLKAEILRENNEKLLELCFVLFMILENLRYPWRRDADIEKMIIFTLRKNNEKEIRSNFYIRMMLPDFGLKMLIEENVQLGIIHTLRYMYENQL